MSLNNFNYTTSAVMYYASNLKIEQLKFLISPKINQEFKQYTVQHEVERLRRDNTLHFDWDSVDWSVIDLYIEKLVNKGESDDI